MAERKISRSSPLLGAVARAVVAASAGMSWPAAQRTGRLLGHLCRLLPNPFRTVSRTNLGWCFPELSEVERRRLLGESLLNLGMTFAEGGPVLRWPAERLRGLVVEETGLELLEAAVARDRGAMLLLPHLGNPEPSNPILADRFELAALYRPTRIVELERALLAARERTGCDVIPARASGLRRFYRAFERGRVVLVLPDQEPVRRSGVFAPYFGIPALTGTLVGRTLRRLRAPALVGVIARRPDGRLDLRITAAPDGLDDPDPVAAATALNAAVEARVRELPEQYFWSYKRFKTRPRAEERALATPGDRTLVTLYPDQRGGEANPQVRYRGGDR